VLTGGCLSTWPQSPVVLVIEDAHWADRSSRDLGVPSPTLKTAVTSMSAADGRCLA
jgi:hypothetical protein